MPVGNIISRIREDARKRVEGGFSTEITITATGELPVIIQGIGIRHNSSFDTDGLPIISSNARITFAEKSLTELGITTRNAQGDLIIQGWNVSFADEIGTLNYIISEAIPDRGVGLIRCQLSDV